MKAVKSGVKQQEILFHCKGACLIVQELNKRREQWHCRLLNITQAALENLKDNLNEIVTPYGNLNRIKTIQGAV